MQSLFDSPSQHERKLRRGQAMSQAYHPHISTSDAGIAPAGVPQPHIAWRYSTKARKLPHASYNALSTETIDCRYGKRLIPQQPGLERQGFRLDDRDSFARQIPDQTRLVCGRSQNHTRQS